jgi:hypothetical protein
MSTNPLPGLWAVSNWYTVSGEKHVAIVALKEPNAITAVALCGKFGANDHDLSVAKANHIAKCVNGHHEAVWLATYVLEDTGYEEQANDEDGTLLGHRPPASTSPFRAPFMRAAAWLIEQGEARWNDGNDRQYVILKERA